ncbi:MAG: hypothetical protein HeimC2_32730 [Candidatus Heimdallarchaeota archaeon LC_2]|nr:MAG: hypothetical protein HeimC2_32730 [Candidatus Heimdallarchaeota archaeon LC_2]
MCPLIQSKEYPGAEINDFSAIEDSKLRLHRLENEGGAIIGLSSNPIRSMLI